MGTHGDVLLEAEPHRALHGQRVAGVEAARDVGRAQRAEQPLVVTHLVGAEALADVGTEVDGGHSCPFPGPHPADPTLRSPARSRRPDRSSEVWLSAAAGA